MGNKFVLIRYVLIVWLLCGYALPNYAQTGAFRTASSTRDQWTMTNMTYQTVTAPAYQFRSTSSLNPVVGTTSYTSTAVYAPGSRPAHARMGDWGDPDDDDNEGLPTGVVPAVPLGEPLILLLLAALFILFKKKRVTSK